MQEYNYYLMFGFLFIFTIETHSFYKSIFTEFNFMHFFKVLEKYPK